MMRILIFVVDFCKRHIDDALLFAGSAAICYGVSLIYVPAAWIVAGVLAIAMGILFGLGGKV